MTTYKDYADAFLCFQNEPELEDVLDPYSGFAPKLKEICLQSKEDADDADEQLLYTMEANTWSLLQAVIPARKTLPAATTRARSLHPYTPPSTLSQSIINASPFLNELIVLREWLQESAPDPTYPEATTSYWNFTKHRINQAARSAGEARTGLVKEMDPDAVTRGQLAPEDMEFEKHFCQCLYTFIRAGKFEDAYHLCHRTQQPWRAASIRGSKIFSWQTLSTEETDKADADGEDDMLPWRGTRKRNLWKSSCIRAALNQSLPNHDRILFAALAPSNQTSNILRSACRTFHDHLWAALSVTCEEKISMELAKIPSFWEGTIDRPVPWLTEEEQDAEDDEWTAEQQTALQGLENIRVEEGPKSDHPFHHTQIRVMLDQTASVFDTFALGLTRGLYPQEVLPPYIRFFTHLALYYKMISLPVPPDSVQVILEAYLSVLESTGHNELIALYAAALGDNAITRYAAFLVHSGIQSNLADRRGALNQARQHGLDVDRVALSAAEQTLVQAFEMLPTPSGELPTFGLPQPPTDAQTLLLRSIEWTTFNEATYESALEQANVIFRYFLAMGLPSHGQTLLAVLPLDLVRMADTEHLHYRQFFSLWQLLDTATTELSKLQPHAKEAISVYHVGTDHPMFLERTDNLNRKFLQIRGRWLSSFSRLIG
ncbi:nuclear pore protein 84/107 [Mucidula mucida]|nr:nuclear pore protein 84/107 [Mucidula mucida]